MVWVVHINRVISWVDKWLFRVSCRMTVKHRLEALKMSVTNAMRPLQFVATTTDCWSARGRSYIGVTAHWIDVDSLERRSVALACKRLKGSHTFDVLASALEDIHAEYAIREKVVKTTMDNGSNFMKAFSVFAACWMMMTMLSHQRCACHSLNLVCTTDAQHAEDNSAYNKLSHSTFAKCQAIWNKSGRSALAAETVQDTCGLMVIRPNQTRWNSIFMSVERLVRIIKEKGENALHSICNDFDLSKSVQSS